METPRQPRRTPDNAPTPPSPAQDTGSREMPGISQQSRQQTAPITRLTQRRLRSLNAVLALACLGGSLLLPALTSGQDTPIADNTLSEAELHEGWISLFDGESLFGWKAAGDAQWAVADGILTGSNGSSPSLLHTTSQFDNYHLRVDFKAPAETNSGVFLRTSPQPRNPAVDCIEVNIATRQVSPFPSGSLVSRIANDRDIAPDVWHTMEMKVEGEHVTVTIDGEASVAHDLKTPLGRGFIGLQFNQGTIHFRNVFLKPLGLGSLFNGRDLEGWRLSASGATTAQVTDSGELQLTGGRGHIETVTAYDDFVFQGDAKTLVAGTNSGIFLRCIPTQDMNGYEVQIQNEIVDNQPTRPKDCGTGGIFRRVDARRVNSQDGQWTALTIVASGPHFAVWVNGLQVTDWSDTRKPDLNPRRGRRDSAGTLMLQGHDPNSQIAFRELRIKSLEPRQR